MRRLIVTAPDIIPGQPDMLPSERGDMLGELRPDVASFAAQPVERTFEIHRVPQDDGGDQEIEAGGSIGLAFEAPVPHFAKPIEEDCPGEGISCLAFVEAGVGTPPEIDILEPFEGKQRPFDAASRRLTSPRA